MNIYKVMEIEELINAMSGEIMEPLQKEVSDKEIHADICHELHELFINKNARYGNSFSEQFEEFGMLSLIIRLSDKLNRLKTLYNGNLDHLDESIEDTLRDLANYSIMGLVELRKKQIKI